MQLVQLNIDRMPGFVRRGFHLEKISKGINVIWGPNGAGKTTTCLAIRKLLWPHDATVEKLTPVVVSSVWSYNQCKEEIIVEGRDYRSTSGIPYAEIQSLRAHAYTITIDELFHATDKEFAEVIAREMRGGYNLHILREGVKITTRFGLAEHRNYLEQQEILAEEIRHQRNLFENERLLDSLEEKILFAEEAKKTLTLVAAALSNKEVQKKYEQVLAKIATFPSGIEHVREEDRKRVEDLKEKKRDLHKALKELREETSSDVNRETLDLCQGWIQEVRILDVKIESLQQSQKECYQQQLVYCSNLQIQPENLENIHLLELDHILPSLQKQHDCSLLQAEIVAKLELIESEERGVEPPTPLGMQKVRQGIALLTSWLYAAKSGWTPVSISTLLCIATITWGAYFLESFTIAKIAALMTLLTACVIPFYSERKRVQQRYLALRLSLPEFWEEENIRLHVQSLETEWASSLIRQRNKQRREDLSHQLQNWQKKYEQLEQEIDLWIQKNKIENIPSYSLLPHFLEQLKMAQTYRAKEKAKETLLVPLLHRKEQFTGQIAGVLGYSFSHVVEMEHALIAEVKRLQEKEQREFLLRESAAIQDSLQEIYLRCGCSGNQEEELFFERVHLFASYLALQQEIKKCEWTLAEIKEQLKSAPQLLNIDIWALEEQKKTLEVRALSVRCLIEQKAGIEKEIDGARHGRRLEKKRLACQDAKEKLEEKKENVRQKILTQFLIEEIEESFKKEKRPEALRKADHFYKQFTAGSYAIHGVEETLSEVGLLSFDCKQGTLKNMCTLSRGTRLQLLLAIRLGIITASEKKGVMLPLILDEAASHADEERWAAIAYSLMELAKEGRQILYFTCQRSQLGAWRMLKESSEITFHDLTEVQDHEPYVVPKEESRIAIPLQEEPLRSYSERIGQPGLDFSQAVGAQHIGHFLSTSNELFDLLQVGVLTYGQWQKISEIKPTYLFLEPHTISIIASKGALLERFWTLYRIGRPFPIEKSDLDDAFESGYVTETFFPGLCLLAHETKGKGAEMLEALEAKRMRRFPKKTIESLREFFQKRAKIDDRSPYGPTELKQFFWEAYGVQDQILSKQAAALFLDYLLECAFHESRDHL